MPELVGFKTMVILDPYGLTFDAVGVFGLDFQLLFKYGSLYWGPSFGDKNLKEILPSFCGVIVNMHWFSTRSGVLDSKTG